MADLKFPGRVSRLQESLRRKKASAFLVTHPGNRRYLSGYTPPDHSIGESSGMLLIPAKGSPYLLTDSRFSLQAGQEAEGFTVQLYDKGLVACLRKMLSGLGIKSLGFEGDYLLHSSYMRLEKMTRKLKVKMVQLDGLVQRQRVVKTEGEIEKIRASVRLNEEVFQSIYKRIQPGMTEREVALAVEREMMDKGADSSSFETIAAFGRNAAKPHAVPSPGRILEKNEIVLIDMGLVLEGYCSDMTRTFTMGSPDKTFLNRLRVVRRAQKAALQAIRDGVVCREVDMAARRVIREAGYGSYFGHALGHGVGLEVHEDPRLSAKSRRKLRTGMIVTVEPGIYLPEWGGIRLEDMVVVHDDGCEILNTDTTFLDL